MSQISAESSSKEESETTKTENNSLSNTDNSSESFSSLKDDQSDIRGKDNEEKGKNPEKKSKKHKDKSQKKVFHHFVRSNTLNISNLPDFPSKSQTQDNSEKNSDDELNDSSSNPSSSSPKKPPPSTRPPPPPSKKPPPSACPPPPPSKKPPSSAFPPPPPSKKPPSSSSPPPPPSKNPPPSTSPPPPPSKKPPSSACPPPPPPKKPPPSSKPPPPPKQKTSTTNDEKKTSTKPPPSANPPPPPSKKPPPSSSPPPPPKQPTTSKELEENIPLSKSGRNNEEDDQNLQLLRMGRQKSKAISGNEKFKHRRYVPVDAPKNTTNIEDVLSTSNTFLISQSPDQSKELSEQEIIQSYFLKKNESRDHDDGDIPIDDGNFEKNCKKSRRIRFDRNSSYSNSVFSNLVDSVELQKLAEQSLKEYNDSFDKEIQSSKLNDELNAMTNENEDLHKKSDDSLPRPNLSPALSDPENLEKLAEINKKAKKILIKRFKKMLENYISEVEINSDFIEIDTSRDSAIHWRKDPHLIKTNELRVESRELENKIASIRMENKDLQNSITDLYQTIGSKNQELMMLQNEISRLKGSSDF